MWAGKTMPVSADAIIEVRKANLETQVEFGRRFNRSRFSVIRWEYDGAKFKYQSARWHTWQAAVSSAIKQSNTKGASNDELSRLHQLQIFR